MQISNTQRYQLAPCKCNIGLQEMGRLRFTAARHPLRPSESGARPHRLDHQAPACVGDVQRSCKSWPARWLWREAIFSRLRCSLVRERSSASSGRLCPSSAPPFWRQRSRCTCGRSPNRFVAIGNRYHGKEFINPVVSLPWSHRADLLFPQSIATDSERFSDAPGLWWRHS